MLHNLDWNNDQSKTYFPISLEKLSQVITFTTGCSNTIHIHQCVTNILFLAEYKYIQYLNIDGILIMNIFVIQILFKSDYQIYLNIRQISTIFFYILSPILDTEVPVGEVDNKILTRQSNPNNPVQKVSGRRLAIKHIMALEIKRFHHSKRNKKGFICEVRFK